MMPLIWPKFRQVNSNAKGIYLSIANEWEAVGSISLQIHDDIRRYSGVLS